MYLKKEEHRSAYDRYQSIRDQLREKFPVDAQSAVKMWFAASKPKAVRMRNRCIMQANIRLQQFLAQISSQVELEVEWSKGLIWLGNKRVAADDPLVLGASDGQYVISLSTDPMQANVMIHFNLTHISNMTGEEQRKIEAALHHLQ